MVNPEWDLLTKVVTANNQGDVDTLYQVLVDPQYEFSDKPRCVQAALSGIHLVEKGVVANREVLLDFVDKISHVEMDFRTGFRFEILKQLLGIAPQSQADIEAFQGMNQANIEMDQQQSAMAPRCHFRPMSLERGDGENYVNTWWECSVCGHVKRNA